MTTTSKPLIKINKLTVDYISHSGFLGRNKQIVRVLNNLELEIEEGEILGIVGESGCGKSTLGNSILRLLEPTGGEVIYKDIDVLQLDKKVLGRLRRQMQMVFQNPHASLNPRMTILNLVAEPLQTHTDMNRKQIETEIDKLLLKVGLSPEYKSRYPHQVSGGQAQRVALARALALHPAFIVLDEPTSALDISVQAQIINLLEELQTEYNLTYLFISHDLSVVQHVSDRIGVMYLGEIVELGDSETIFESPRHPYTQALLSATPIPDPDIKRKYIVLKGEVPSAANPPSGCRFHPRCPIAKPQCAHSKPHLKYIGKNHLVACLLVGEDEKE